MYIRDGSLALLSGVLLSLSFPKFGHSVIAWVSLAPLLLVLSGRLGSIERLSGKSQSIISSSPDTGWACALGLLTGFGYFTGTLYWITGVMVTYGGLNLWQGIAVNGLLVAGLSVFPLLFTLTVALLSSRLGWLRLIVIPSVWVATELGRTHVLGGFPWALVGYSQVNVLPVVQIASVVGVYGVSWLVVMINVALVDCVLVRGRERVINVGCAALTLILVVVWGSWRLSDNKLPREGTSIRIGIVQGNIAQKDKRSLGLRQSILETYLTASRKVAAEGARLIVWPESATPFVFEENIAGSEMVRKLAIEANVHVLFGSEEVKNEPTFQYFNAAFLVNQNGRSDGVYRKMHLVPFGEYVPFRQVLFFADKLVASVSDFSAGTTPSTFVVDGHRMSTAICYEVVYPALIHQFIGEGSELITTITNDAWFGRSSAPHQHFGQAAMRAVEQGRYLVRSANTGISGIVDPYGRVLAQTELFTRDTVVGDVRWLQGKTIYGRTGDLFAYLCSLLSIAGLLVLGTMRLSRKPSVHRRTL